MGTDFKKRIVMVEDHPIMLKGLVLTLESDPNFEVVEQFDRGEVLISRLDELKPDLIIVDISLPGMSGLELVKHLIAQNEELKILVVSRHDESLYAERVIRAGAKGYLMKQEAGDVLLTAVRKVLRGSIYVSDEVSEHLLLGMARGQKEAMESPIEKLSDRELEVFELTGKGSNTRKIADRLHLSIKTVESYRARIKTKLNLDNINELMVHAVKWAENESANSYQEID